MIWNAVRHIMFVETATAAIFWAVLVILAGVGLRFSPAIAVALVVLWAAVFLTIYRIRYQRL